MEGRGRRDDDQRTPGIAQHGMKSGGASHQADQVDFQHLAEARHLELATPVDHRTLRQHEHVEAIEIWIEAFDGVGVADVKPRIVKSAKTRAFLRRVVGGVYARAAYRNACALLAKGLRDPVPDAARAADHKNLLTAEIELVHLPHLTFLACLTVLGLPPALSITPSATRKMQGWLPAACVDIIRSGSSFVGKSRGKAAHRLQEKRDGDGDPPASQAFRRRGVRPRSAQTPDQ